MTLFTDSLISLLIAILCRDKLEDVAGYKLFAI